MNALVGTVIKWIEFGWHHVEEDPTDEDGDNLITIHPEMHGDPYFVSIRDSILLEILHQSPIDPRWIENDSAHEKEMLKQQKGMEQNVIIPNQPS